MNRLVAIAGFALWAGCMGAGSLWAQDQIVSTRVSAVASGNGTVIDR